MITDNAKMLAAAQYWAGKGFKVFPLRKGLKIPATGDGFKSATTSDEALNHWFNNDLGYNLGLATGHGLVVVDLDRKHGVDGLASLSELEQTLGALPETLTVSTPSGGEHRFFGYPAEIDIKSNAGQIGAGIDIRANGGYVVGAPSRLEAGADSSGKTVTGDYVITKRQPIAGLPHEWLERLTTKRERVPNREHSPASTQQTNYQRLAEIQDALTCINAQPHDDWVRVGMALYSLGNDGLHLWDAWSRNAANYDPKEIPKRWKSFEGASVGIETVFYMAAQHGWQNPAKGRKLEPATNHTPPRQYQHDPAYSRAMDAELDHVRLVDASSIVPKRLEWVWDQWLPQGKLTLLVGAPKTGKTLLAIDVAARITSGGKFPDGTLAKAAPVIFWTAEDDLNDTIVPRFKAAGGNLENLKFIDSTVSSGKGQPFNPAADMPELLKAISGMKRKPALMILDPIVSVSRDLNNAIQVREGLAPIREIAETYGVAVLGITHFRKSSAESGGDGERIIGSGAFLAVSRMVWFAKKPPDSDGQRVVHLGDNNLAESDQGFVYEVETRDADFPEHNLVVTTAGVVWGEKLEGDELHAFLKPDTKNESAPALVEAEDFLKEYLASGERLKAEIEEEADNRGIARETLKRAKKSLGILHKKRRGDGKSVWYPKQLGQAHPLEPVERVDPVERVVERETVVI